MKYTKFNHLMVFGCSNTLYGHINDEPTSRLPRGEFQAAHSWSDMRTWIVHWDYYRHLISLVEAADV